MQPLPLRLSLALTLLSAAVASAAPPLDPAPSPRQDISFNPNWKFIKQDVPDAQNPAFADKDWTTVSCPHTFNDVDTFDDFSPGGHIGELKQWAGKTWYRKHFTPDASWQNKKVYIEFEAVRQLTDVYLNGQKLGSSNTGFTPFGFDLTPLLKPGQDNVLSLMVDNTFVTHGGENANAKKPNEEIIKEGTAAAKNGDTPPQDDAPAAPAAKKGPKKVAGVPWNDPHWHPAHGGIYRNVFLHVTDKLHVTLPLYSNLGTTGTYIFAKNISKESADVTVNAEVENDYDAPKNTECTSEVKDAQGNVVLTVKESATVAPGEKHTFTSTGKVASPKLWEPDAPNLYTVTTTLRSDGQVTDTYNTPLGIRDAHFTVDKGFFINGHPLKLHGFGQKPTDEWAGLGAAQPDWLHTFTLQMMKDDHANFVRWGHCATGPGMIRACDQLGIIAYQPGCDGENDPNVDVVPELVAPMWKLRTEAMRDTLIYFRNNPSILIWEVANKVLTKPHIEEITKIEHQWDPSGGRYETMRRPDETDGKYLEIMTGTEGGHEIKTLPNVEGEYNRAESPRRVWDNASPPNFGYKEIADIEKATGKKQTWNLNSEQFAVDQAAQYEKISAPSHNGGAKWIFSDTTSGGRVTVETTRASGAVDGVRLPKEAYYATQVIFSNTPAIHIIGHWTYPAKTVKPLYVFANCDEVELYVNKKFVGDGVRSNQFLYTFPDVKYAAGTVEAVGYTGGKVVCKTELHTAGAPAAIKLTPITQPGGLQANGADVALIDAEVVDKDGNRCPTFQGRIDFTTTGPAIWRGGYNSGKEHSTNNPYLDLECGINRVAVRSTLEPGAIHIEAKVESLPPASVDIASH